METANELFASKQCTINQDEVKSTNPASSFQEKFVYFTARRNGSSSNSGFEEEPIDLSNYNRGMEENRSETLCLRQGFSDAAQQTRSEPFQLVNFPENGLNVQRGNYFPRPKRKRRKFVFTQDGNFMLISGDNETATTFTTSKQQEILNAARALFSKRTRTLYHWMYPNAAKQQIKTIIANSWDSLEDKEKEFYVSQVLGRFGFPQSNLMINPQLCSIKHLPPPPPSSEQRSNKSETVVGVATTERGGVEGGMMERGGAVLERGVARKRGRPKSSQGCRRMIARDFQDDPELSQELEKFAITFNLSSVV